MSRSRPGFVRFVSGPKNRKTFRPVTGFFGFAKDRTLSARVSLKQFVIVPPADPNPDPNIPEQPQLHDDTRFAAGKIAIFQYSTVVVFLVLISGFWRLQVQNPELYEELALQNRIKSQPSVAPRGGILARDKSVIVDNQVSSRRVLTRENSSKWKT